VFPVRYELNIYILFRINSVLKCNVLPLMRKTIHEDSCIQYLGYIGLLFSIQLGLGGKDSDLYPGGDWF
jgi:hypothetical protein